MFCERNRQVIRYYLSLLVLIILCFSSSGLLANEDQEKGSKVSKPTVKQFDYSPGFTAGKPEEMNKLAFLEGNWAINLSYRVLDKTGKPIWVPASQVPSSISSIYDGSFLIEDNDGFPIGPGSLGNDGITKWSYHVLYSWDRFQNQYRAVAADNVLGLADIYEGVFEGDTLFLTNLTTSTYNNMGSDGGTQKNRIVIKDIAADSFTLTWQAVDGSAVTTDDHNDVPWVPVIRLSYSRIASE